MDGLARLLAVIGILGTGVIGGLLFVFSNTVMRALERLPERQGMAAMQSINVVILNPLFFGVFLGTTGVSLAAFGLSILRWGEAGTPLYAFASAFYIVGVFLVTGIRNVPLNDRLGAVPVTDPRADAIWSDYLIRWTRWNHLRTASALLATLLFSLGFAWQGLTA